MLRLRKNALAFTALIALAAPIGACASSTSDGFADAGSGGSSGGGGTSGGGGPFASGGPGGAGSSVNGAGCITIASLGQPAHYGVNGLNSDSTQAFTDWLDTKSSAMVDLYTTHTTLTPDLLSKYNVLIIQWLTDSNTGPYWTFTADEISALKDWVNAGGGLITLSGYDSNAAEVTPLNQLLSFTDISYNMDDVLGACAASYTNSQNQNSCFCWGNSVPLAGWQATPIGAHITELGAFHGRSINSASAAVDVSDAMTGAKYAVHEQVGSGYVFAYFDEWVTYSSQWLGTSPVNTSSMYTDPNNFCYMKSAADVFQVPQFWFNAISWVSQATMCQFTIMDPSIVQ